MHMAEIGPVEKAQKADNSGLRICDLFSSPP